MRYLFLIGFVFCSFLGMSQDKKIDQLEILYDQAYYTKVLRKSSKLIAMPAYDYSGLPSFYKSLALFRLSNDDQWFDRHDYAINEAVIAYKDFMDNENIKDYLAAHYHEIASLKTYLVDLETKFKKLRLNGSADQIQSFRLNELKGIKAKPDVEIDRHDKDDTVVVTDGGATNTNTNNNSGNSSIRERMVVYAKSLVGVKYTWAGTSPKGFDCSGLVGYVHKKYGLLIPRTASAQLNGSKKVKLNDAFRGDLLFFSSGKNISHVGLVINQKGENLIMVHASTSKGVIITEIEKSTYWKPKLKAAGTFI
ncbi:MAG: cell wall-associated NlpC family hydrolase [Crocinitomix sp.]|jgi:cell wall-associated NlpC family hydrolase